MLERWLDTSRDSDCIRHWSAGGGGKGCTQTPFSLPRAVVVRELGSPHLNPFHSDVDVMELPRTTQGNKYVVFFLSKCFQHQIKSLRIAKLLVEEVVPLFGVPEALLSDRGANLLSHLMQDVCTLIGVKKLNTTAYHPQCDGMIERFNRTLKGMLRKHAAKFGTLTCTVFVGL